MDINSQLKYRVLMGGRIYLPEHFKKRYKERVSKGSDRALDFTREAYILGKDIDQIDDQVKKDFFQRKIYGGRTCRIYRGFVFIFRLNRAITVFPIPNIKSLKRSI